MSRIHPRHSRVSLPAARPGWWLRLTASLFGNDRASISPMFALLLIPISGSIAFAVELGGFYYVQRSAQNAADAAAIAAATNNSASGSTFQNEARAAAKPYGYTDGVDGAVVSAAVATCPAGTTGTTPVCYEAVVTTSFPLVFSRVIGFLGTTGSGSQTVGARAVAVASGSAGGGTPTACLWALGTGGTMLLGDGIPAANLQGCAVMSNGSIRCNGSNDNGMEADYAIAGSGTSSGCAKKPENDIEPGDPGWVAPPADPYLAKTAPSVAGCGSNPSSTTINADITASVSYCGDVILGKDVKIKGANVVLTISNGTLDLNGKTLKTEDVGATTSSATLIFTGTNAADRQHYPTSSKNNSGTLEIRAPTSGTWANIAIYQGRNLTNHTYGPGGKNNTVNLEYTGNQPTWNVAGIVYMPNATTTFKGAVGKYGNAVDCFVLMAYSIDIRGTGETIAHNTTTGCQTAGYSTPTATIAGTSYRTRLVF